jgi:hypothetical protein
MRTAHKLAFHQVLRLAAGGLLALILIACGDTAGCKITGAWHSDGDYLFVPHGETGCVATSNIADLRGALRQAAWFTDAVIDVYDDESKLTAWISPRLHETGFDTLYVRLRGGEERMFIKESTSGTTLFESLGAYSRGFGSTTWEFPDGGPRLAWLYYIGLVLAFFLGLPIIATIIGWDLNDDDFGRVFFGLFVCGILPPISGFLCGWGHNLIYGWWDARLAGAWFINTVIAVPCVVLLILLVYLLLLVRSFKESRVATSGVPIRTILFWLLIATDAVSLVTNLHFLARLVFG